MPCGKRNVFTPCSFSRFYKIFSPIFSYSEFFYIFLVFFLIGFILPIIPFAFTYNAVKTEMYKHSESESFEILYIFVCHFYILPKRSLITFANKACPSLFYHTLLDWHNTDYKTNFPKYIDYLVQSVEMLCRNYGKIGGFWFDGMWDKPNENWQEDRIYGTIRKYQPEAMIINNTGLNALGQTGHIEIDSVTFERGKPAFVDTSKKPIAGEVCDALTDHWGYAKYDICIKSPKDLVETLVDCRKYGCNLLLNSGLKGNGEMSAGERFAFEQIGMWIRLNKNFIYNVKSANIFADNADVMFDGEYYYAAVKDVFMCANCNVAKFGENKIVTVKTDKRIVDAVWLDNGKRIDLKTKNSFECLPFEYGKSLSVKIARFKLEKD